jgi:hypothetical protein
MFWLLMKRFLAVAILGISEVHWWQILVDKFSDETS